MVTLTSVTSGDPQITLDGAAATAATVTIADNDSATVSITANDATAGETATEQRPVHRQPDPGRARPTRWSATRSAAPPPAARDYTALTGTVTILAGQTSATIDVSGIVDDNIVEADETVVVTLTSVTSGDPQITLDATPPT